MGRLSLAVFLLCLIASGYQISSAQRTFNLNNACSYTVWPATLSNAGVAILWQGGTSLAPGATYQYTAPAGWAGRVWGRTGCTFDTAGGGTCLTGDCGKGLLCNGAGGVPPATLTEFTLDGAGGQDFYDVSLVDGYNLPLSVQPSGGGGVAGNSSCGSPGCTSDLNPSCPSQLQVVVDGAVVACKSACEAFQSDNYCCSGAFNSPSVCVATNFSQVFKTACPTSYSYAYDDASSTFTCAGPAAYTITFCPSGTSSGVGTPPAVGTPPTSNTTVPPPPPNATALVPPPPPLILVPPPPPPLSPNTTLVPPPPIDPNTTLVPPPPATPNATTVLPPPPPLNVTAGLIPPPPPLTTLVPPPPPSTVGLIYPPPPPALGFLYPPPPGIAAPGPQTSTPGSDDPYSTDGGSSYSAAVSTTRSSSFHLPLFVCAAAALPIMMAA